MNSSVKRATTASYVVNNILEHYGYTPSQLVSKIGARSSQIYNMLDGRCEIVGKRYAMLISNAFPELRYDWIITGRGDMFEPKKQTAKPEPPATSTESATSIPVYHNPDLASVMLSMLSKIEDLSSIIRQQNRQITSLSLLANEQKARLDALVDALAAATSLPVAPAPMPSSYHYDSLVADNSTQDDSQPIG